MTARPGHPARGLALAAAVLAAALAACPLPQPLPEVSRSDGGSVSTPLILPETAVPSDSVVFVSRDCVPDPQFSVSATVEDANTTESVEARWFVDYGIGSGAGDNTGVQGEELQVLPSADPSDPLRSLTPFVFTPYFFGKTAPLHVVEVAVSNGFLPINDPTPPRNRSASLPFETQSFRWVFQYVDTGDPRGRCQ